MATFWSAGYLACALVVQTPDTSASVIGTVRDESGAPVPGVQVLVVGTMRRAATDAQGRYELRGLAAGPVELSTRFIGYMPVNTSFRLRPGERRVWDVVLGGSDWQQAAEAESARVATGGIDSIRTGRVSTDTTLAFTYERFGIQLLRAAVWSGSPDSSRVLSPLSAGQALAVALKGAKDSTALAVRRTLVLNSLSSDDLAIRDQRFNGALRARTDATLKVANALWVDTVATLQSPFERWAREYYGASVRRLALQSAEVVQLLNRWADSTTNGAIPKVRREPFRNHIELVLTNAVYFKGRWLEPFDSTRTQPRPFTTAGGRQLRPPTMERTEYLAYRRAAGYQVVRIPYAAGLTAMYLVLPDSGRTPAATLESMSGGWPLPDSRSDVREVHLRLPRLHIAQATDLRGPLTRLGMGIAFDSSRADFGDLITPRPNMPPPCPPLSSGRFSGFCTRYRMDEAKQHVYLDVDERGTVAAAVTSLAFESVIITAAPPPIPFFVDRPFLFALRDEKSGVFLFMGVVVNPMQ